MRISVPAVPAPSTAKPVATPSWRAFSASGVGLEMGLYVILGFLAGNWIDGQLGTTPWLMITMVLFGVVIGVISMIRASRAAWGLGAASNDTTERTTAGGDDGFGASPEVKA